MDNEFVNSQKDEKVKQDSSEGGRQDAFSSKENHYDSSKSSSAWTLRRVNSDHSLMSNAKRMQNSRRCTKSAVLQNFCSSGSRIPKDIVTLDEKYLRHCLELIHKSASKAASLKISVDLGSPMTRISSHSLNLAQTGGENSDTLTRLVFDCSLATGTGKIVAGPAGQWIVGSLMGSKSMINIMKNPLFQRSGTLDGDINFRISNMDDYKVSSTDNFADSPNQLSVCSPMDQGKETPVLKTYTYGTDTGHRRLISMASRNSTSTDQSASSAAAAVSQGMLHITWKGGIPYFVFSLDDQKDVYVTNLMNAGSTGSGSPQYEYLFYSRMHDHKENGYRNKEPHLVGKMKVSTSASLCPDDSKIMETEFVLSGISETPSEEMQASSNNHRRRKVLPKKVVELFRNSHSSKQRSISKFDGTNAILENSFSETCQEMSHNFDTPGGERFSENSLVPYLELVAIVVKDHLKDDRQVEAGGWGLKFLRKAGVGKTLNVSDAVSSGCCADETGKCPASIDIIIPADVHGGPRTKNGGPSTLTERWKSGGQCDCGGWDLGCPLTVLKTRSTQQEPFLQEYMQEKGRPFDLYIQGSRQSVPTLRMINVHEGLYLVHFQSNLSALQSFSIAVAHIHTQSPILQPKVCRLKKQ